ncbi:EpsG family protein [Myroides odoratimimus]|uniref:EpsG family protein n=1 Tax=Myroides odoratimimus TaxID=76832 RepID=UPI002DBD97D6|nr:EpsG family protein [Myroides odoratimimus]MEC4008535.1 EpsG family protein [Myroides odoratimimus]
MTRDLRKSIDNVIFWLLSPLLSVFVVLYNILQKDKRSILFFSLILGVLSFIYIPLDGDDRVRHYERFYQIAELSGLSEFLDYLIGNNLPDFFVYFIMYLISIVSNDPRLVFFLATTFCTFSFFYVYLKVIKDIGKLPNIAFFLCFLVVLMSFNYGYLLSGLRFYVGASFSLLAWYNLFYLNKKKIGGLFLLLAVASHFASLLLVLGSVGLYLFKKVNYKYFFYFSFFFVVLPGSFLFGIISSLPVGASITSKAYDYLMFNDILLSAAETAGTLKILLLIKRSWIFIILVLVLLKRKENEGNNFLLKSVFLFVGIRNLFAGSPTISQYYDTFAIFISLLYVLNSIQLKKLGKGYVFLIFIVLNFMIDIYKYRENFIQSNIKLENLTSVSIFGSDVAEPIKTTWK